MQMEQADNEEKNEKRIGNNAWLENVKLSVEKSVEWQLLSREVFHGVEKFMDDHRIQYFADLTEEERRIVIDNVQDSISEEKFYLNFRRVMAEKLDEGLSGAVAKDVAEEKGTQMELLADHSARGMAALLSKVNMKETTLRLLLNCRIPLFLRVHIWERFLRDPASLEQYKTRVTTRRGVALLVNSLEMVETCQLIATSQIESVFDVAPTVHTMKTVLSYMSMTMGKRIEKHMFYCCLPLTVVFGNRPESIPRVVEALCALMALPLVLWTEESDPNQFANYVHTFTTTFKAWNEPLYQHLEGLVMKKHDNDDGDDEKLDDPVSSSRVAVFRLVKPFLEQQFVDVLDLQTCLYVWDQCLLCGYDKMTIPMIIAILIGIQDPLMRQTTVGGAQQAVVNQSCLLTVSQLQGVLETHFMGSIREEYQLPRHGVSQWKDEPAEFITDFDDILGHMQTEALESLKSSLVVLESDEEVKAKLEEKHKSLQAVSLGLPKDSSHTGSDSDEKSETTDEETEVEDDEEGEVSQPAAEKEKEIPRSPSEKSSKSMQSSSVDMDELEFPEWKPRLHSFSDTIARTVEMNPELTIQDAETLVELRYEEIDVSKKHGYEKSKVYKLKEQEKVLIMRTLKADEGEDVAGELVDDELERMKLTIQAPRRDAIIKHLIRFSKRSEGTAPEKEPKKEEEKVENPKGPLVIASLINAVLSLQADIPKKSS